MDRRIFVSALGLGLPAQEPARRELPASPQESTQALEFELNGLRYQTLTRAGLTVMFAQTPALVRGYNILQVTVANGSKRTVEVKPGDFTFVDRATARRLNPMAPRLIVEEFLDQAKKEDVITLVKAYEQTLYGMTRVSSTSGYERRRQAALAEFQNVRLRAGATASAIVFVATKLAAGESTDGALFFATMGRPIGAGKLLVTTAQQSFEFDTYANPLDPNAPAK
jgi:hypothetical protein